MWESKLSSITKVRFIMNRIILDCKSPSYNETLFGLSFLTTPNLYKDCFKGRQRLHSCASVKKSFVHANCDWRQNLP